MAASSWSPGIAGVQRRPESGEPTDNTGPAACAAYTEDASRLLSASDWFPDSHWSSSSSRYNSRSQSSTSSRGSSRRCNSSSPVPSGQEVLRRDVSLPEPARAPSGPASLRPQHSKNKQSKSVVLARNTVPRSSATDSQLPQAIDPSAGAAVASADLLQRGSESCGVSGEGGGGATASLVCGPLAVQQTLGERQQLIERRMMELRQQNRRRLQRRQQAAKEQQLQRVREQHAALLARRQRLKLASLWKERGMAAAARPPSLSTGSCFLPQAEAEPPQQSCTDTRNAEELLAALVISESISLQHVDGSSDNGVSVAENTGQAPAAAPLPAPQSQRSSFSSSAEPSSRESFSSSGGPWPSLKSFNRSGSQYEHLRSLLLGYTRGASVSLYRHTSTTTSSRCVECGAAAGVVAPLPERTPASLVLQHPCMRRRGSGNVFSLLRRFQGPLHSGGRTAADNCQQHQQQASCSAALTADPVGERLQARYSEGTVRFRSEQSYRTLSSRPHRSEKRPQRQDILRLNARGIPYSYSGGSYNTSGSRPSGPTVPLPPYVRQKQEKKRLSSVQQRVLPPPSSRKQNVVSLQRKGNRRQTEKGTEEQQSTVIVADPQLKRQLQLQLEQQQHYQRDTPASPRSINPPTPCLTQQRTHSATPTTKGAGVSAQRKETRSASGEEKSATVATESQEGLICKRSNVEGMAGAHKSNSPEDRGSDCSQFQLTCQKPKTNTTSLTTYSQSLRECGPQHHQEALPPSEGEREDPAVKGSVNQSPTPAEDFHQKPTYSLSQGAARAQTEGLQFIRVFHQGRREATSENSKMNCRRGSRIDCKINPSGEKDTCCHSVPPVNVPSSSRMQLQATNVCTSNPKSTGQLPCLAFGPLACVASAMEQQQRESEPCCRAALFPAANGNSTCSSTSSGAGFASGTAEMWHVCDPLIDFSSNWPEGNDATASAVRALEKAELLEEKRLLLLEVSHHAIEKQAQSRSRELELQQQLQQQLLLLKQQQEATQAKLSAHCELRKQQQRRQEGLQEGRAACSVESFPSASLIPMTAKQSGASSSGKHSGNAVTDILTSEERTTPTDNPTHLLGMGEKGRLSQGKRKGGMHYESLSLTNLQTLLHELLRKCFPDTQSNEKAKRAESCSSALSTQLQGNLKERAEGNFQQREMILQALQQLLLLPVATTPAPVGVGEKSTAKGNKTFLPAPQQQQKDSRLQTQRQQKVSSIRTAIPTVSAPQRRSSQRGAGAYSRKPTIQPQHSCGGQQQQESKKEQKQLGVEIQSRSSLSADVRMSNGQGDGDSGAVQGQEQQQLLAAAILGPLFAGLLHQYPLQLQQQQQPSQQ